jgi:hypothetical protein
MADLKQVLLRLGDKLVKEHDFSPAALSPGGEKPKTTSPLVQFLWWLDKTPEAREELENLGFSFLRTTPFQT